MSKDLLANEGELGLSPSLIAFIRKQHLLSLATCKDGVPHGASCFYAFESRKGLLVIATDAKSRHGKEALLNPHIAGTIALHTRMVGKIQGVQFSGTYRPATPEEAKVYFKRFPYALAMQPELWSIVIDTLKFTDNTLGFGSKSIFSRFQP